MNTNSLKYCGFDLGSKKQIHFFLSFCLRTWSWVRLSLWAVQMNVLSSTQEFRTVSASELSVSITTHFCPLTLHLKPKATLHLKPNLQPETLQSLRAVSPSRGTPTLSICVRAAVCPWTLRRNYNQHHNDNSADEVASKLGNRAWLGRSETQKADILS